VIFGIYNGKSPEKDEIPLVALRASSLATLSTKTRRDKMVANPISANRIRTGKKDRYITYIIYECGGVCVYLPEGRVSDIRGEEPECQLAGNKYNSFDKNIVVVTEDYVETRS